MNQNISQSLALAGIGMTLVFLALLIIAAIIMALSRVFRTRQPSAVEPNPASEDDAALEPEPTAVSFSDETAAIATAIALQRRRPSTSSFSRKVDYSESEVIGEVVNVVGISANASTWANAGRLQTTK